MNIKAFTPTIIQWENFITENIYFLLAELITHKNKYYLSLNDVEMIFRLRREKIKYFFGVSAGWNKDL
jgi:hypothetical protein